MLQHAISSNAEAVTDFDGRATISKNADAASTIERLAGKALHHLWRKMSIQLDPRGPRFAAALTALVLVAVLSTGSGWLALIQTMVFAVTAVDPRSGPYALLYRALVAPYLKPATERENAAPVRFAQVVGFVVLAVASIGYFAGAPTVGLVFAACGLLAAFLNAAFGFCLGCEAYLAARRLSGRRA